MTNNSPAKVVPPWARCTADSLAARATGSADRIRTAAARSVPVIRSAVHGVAPRGSSRATPTSAMANAANVSVDAKSRCTAVISNTGPRSARNSRTNFSNGVPGGCVEPTLADRSSVPATWRKTTRAPVRCAVCSSGIAYGSTSHPTSTLPTHWPSTTRSACSRP
ncbi:Uncharacterised protein [Mycobacterium tuberculosis]|uniref:Uncharacterized protein n=1 Tax=Mycobacterium tuberculosis TaxID=1773 RepID=A0A916LAK9_MYCTX|nr:Uncharacterised protein [Mycobacterium tuberculosis]